MLLEGKAHDGWVYTYCLMECARLRYMPMTFISLTSIAFDAGVAAARCHIYMLTSLPAIFCCHVFRVLHSGAYTRAYNELCKMFWRLAYYAGGAIHPRASPVAVPHTMTRHVDAAACRKPSLLDRLEQREQVHAYITAVGTGMPSCR